MGAPEAVLSRIKYVFYLQEGTELAIEGLLNYLGWKGKPGYGPEAIRVIRVKGGFF